MLSSTILTLFAGVLASAGTSMSNSPEVQAHMPNCPPQAATLEQQRFILSQFTKAFYEERNATKALFNHVAEDYIQHNPNALSGRQNTLNALAPILPSDNMNFTVLRSALDNNIAFVHYRMDIEGGQPSAIVDVYRFNGTCILEHWDVLQERDPSSINPLALF